MLRSVAVVVGTLGLFVAISVVADDKVDGKKVYDTKCAVCHAMGVAGAPKFGDKVAWEPRLKTGNDALVQSVIKGKNAMPPRAGQNASDDEIKAAVAYMADKAK